MQEKLPSCTGFKLTRSCRPFLPLALMWRQCSTRTSSSKYGTWEGRPASDPIGGVTIPTPMLLFMWWILLTRIALATRKKSCD
eukprot:symbB.v1.2.029576.t1/scaffold3252.1/size60189/2